LKTVAKDSYNILVVCTGNICRSPMAEGMLKKNLPERLSGKVMISSAGTHALHGNMAQPHAITVMRGFDIDISSHRARQLSGALVRSSNLILVMERFHLRLIKVRSMLSPAKVRMLTAYEEHGEPYDVPDPMGEPIAAYEASAAIIHNCVKGVYAYLDTIIETT
jgi:protein-tyrosine phosphatase